MEILYWCSLQACTTIHSEKKDTVSAADRWITDVLPSLFNDYKSEDIYNYDETGIHYRAMPDRTLAHKMEAILGSQKAKDRITALVCANMTSAFRAIFIRES